MYARLRRIASLVPLFWVSLPELGTLIVNHIGPRQAIELLYWCVAADIVLLSVVIWGVICLLLKRLRCWPDYSPERA